MKSKLYPYFTIKNTIGTIIASAAAAGCFALMTVDKYPFLAMGILCLVVAAVLMICFTVKTYKKRKSFVRVFGFSDSDRLVAFHAKDVSVSDARIVSLAFDPLFLDDLCRSLSKVTQKVIESRKMPSVLTVYYCPVGSISVYGMRCRGKQQGKYAWIEFYPNHFRAYDMFSLARHEIGHALLTANNVGGNQEEILSRVGI